MSAGAVWRTLGIGRTEDEAAIRKAYAGKLKEIDVEADPAAFIALRGARDHALAMAAMASMPAFEPDEADEAGWAEEEDGPGFLVFEDPWQPPPLPADPDVAEVEARRALLAEVEALLFPADDEAAVDSERLEALTARILSGPEMMEIEHAAQIEAWLAGAAAASIPRSDAMLPLLISHFGWEDKWGEWDQSDEVIALVERHRAFLFLQYVAQPGHRLHKAWLDLTNDDATLGWNRFLVAGKVSTLLTLIRDRYPAAESGLDWYRVSLWDMHFGGSVQRMLKIAMVIFWIGFVAVRFLPWYGQVSRQ